MKTPTKKQTDAVAWMKFVQDNNRREDWQGKALAEVAYMAPDLGVTWPIDRNAGERDALVCYALDCISAAMDPAASLETAFNAGRATQQVSDLWIRILQCSGNRRSAHFYIIAENLRAKGARPNAAYAKAKAWIAKNHPDWPIPTPASYKEHRAEQRRKQKTGKG